MSDIETGSRHGNRSARIVVLRPTDSAPSAARAMRDNHVGCVLVWAPGGPLGIVTDRDLAMAVATGLDPRRIQLKDFAADVVVTCTPDAATRDVLAAMRLHACRRVPIVEGGRPVGIVTLDDLILEGAATRDEIADVIRAQLELPERLKPAGATKPRRGDAAAADRRYEALVTEVEQACALVRPRAAAALAVALAALVAELTKPTASAVMAQLPERVATEVRGAASDDAKTAWAALARETGAAPDRLLSLVVALGDRLSTPRTEGDLGRAVQTLLDASSHSVAC